MAFDLKTGLSSPTGARLSTHVMLATATPIGVLQISHGLAEHAGRYDRFARFMAARGFHVFAHDHRGHGKTTAPDAPRGVFASADGAAKVVADVFAVRDRIAVEHPKLPVILFGHSMGGLVALNVLKAHSDRYFSAAIWNANFSAGLAGHAARAILAWERFRLGSDVPSRMLPKLTFQAWGKQVTDGRTAFDWLSRDRDEVDKYVADPACGWDASVSMWRDLFDLVFRGASDDIFATIRKDMPLNLVGGAKDPATFGGKSVSALADRLKANGFTNAVSRIYPETRHESLNEVNRDMIMAEFANWATKIMPR